MNREIPTSKCVELCFYLNNNPHRLNKFWGIIFRYFSLLLKLARRGPVENRTYDCKVRVSRKAKNSQFTRSRGFNFVFLLVTKIPYHAITLRAKGFVTRGPRAGLLCHAIISRNILWAGGLDSHCTCSWKELANERGNYRRNRIIMTSVTLTNR